MSARQERQVTEAQVVLKLNSNQKSVEWAILHMLGRQTAEELLSEATLIKNGVGFSASDASFFTYLGEFMTGKQMSRPDDEIKNHLSGRFLVEARERLFKYRRQITEIVNQAYEQKAEQT